MTYQGEGEYFISSTGILQLAFALRLLLSPLPLTSYLVFAQVAPFNFHQDHEKNEDKNYIQQTKSQVS